MKGSDKAIVLGVVMAVILGVFYLKVLSPKRQEASKLGKENTDLQAQIDQQKQTAQFGEAARQEFPTYYGRMVVLGKAVPAEADTGSLMVQLNGLAHRTDVDFVGISLANATSASAATPPAPSSTSSTSTSSGSTSTTGSSSTDSSSGSSSSGSSSSGTSGSTTTTSTTTPAPATEAGAASLPIGSAVGPAGLPIMPYNLTFTGSYFEVANFVKGVDDLVHLRDTGFVAADGRLMTVDGFSLSYLGQKNGQPLLNVNLFVTSYVTPASQGLTAGASPTGPATSLTQPQTQPASQTVAP